MSKNRIGSKFIQVFILILDFIKREVRLDVEEQDEEDLLERRAIGCNMHNFRCKTQMGGAKLHMNRLSWLNGPFLSFLSAHFNVLCSPVINGFFIIGSPQSRNKKFLTPTYDIKLFKC